jgi:anti-sigma regulatory factor (Ser/Thr protein kinase)
MDKFPTANGFPAANGLPAADGLPVPDGLPAADGFPAVTARPPAPGPPPAPPYLLIGRLDPAVSVTGDAGLETIDVAVHGRWSPRLSDQVSAALRTCRAGPSESIIIDLRDLGDPAAASLPFWLAVWRRARLGAAPATVTFCLPTTTVLSRRLRHLRGPQPRVVASVPEARAIIAARVSRADRRQVRLPPRPASVRAARGLVTQACEAWQRPHQLADTGLIVSELAANAVEHAGTDLVVTVARRGARLSVAIHDRLGTFPDRVPPVPADPSAVLGERGRGLRLVDAVAAAWGAVPAHRGKVVWATVI